MATQRQTSRAELNARLALAALKGPQPLHDMAAHDGVPPNQVMPWKKQALAELPPLFTARRARVAQAEETLRAQLYQPLGRRPVDLAWLKKTAGLLSCGHTSAERAGAAAPLGTPPG